jgi:hypothetical protein
MNSDPSSARRLRENLRRRALGVTLFACGLIAQTVANIAAS